MVPLRCPHWGLHKEVLAYMPEIAHAAIDAGADLVIGHGPHHALPVEVYRGAAGTVTGSG
jgi:poly-gamma-glutamate synthesis protein (capsule biosynthesis protein)